MNHGTDICDSTEKEPPTITLIQEEFFFMFLVCQWNSSGICKVSVTKIKTWTVTSLVYVTEVDDILWYDTPSQPMLWSSNIT